MVKKLSNYSFRRGRSVRVAEKDLELLLFLLQNEILSVTQVKFLFKRLYQDNENAVFRKLQKWHDEGIVKKSIYTTRSDSRNPLACVQIKENGMYILEKEGLITKENFSYRDVKLPSFSRADMIFGTKEIVIRTFLEFKMKGGFFYSLSPNKIIHYSNPVIQNIDNPENNNLSQSPRVAVPNWILTNPSKDIFIYIECDTGTQGINKILNKLKGYGKLASREIDKAHHVLIATMDSIDSDQIRYIFTPSKNRTRRIASLKYRILEKYFEQLPPNLYIHVATSSRAGKVAYSILTGMESNETEVSNYVIQILNDSDSPFKSVNEVIPTEFYDSQIDSSLYGDLHLVLSKDTESEKTVMIKFMKEASLKSLYELYYLNRLVEDNKMLRHVDAIIAVFENGDELKNVVFPEKWTLNHVLFSSIEQIKKQEFFRFTSPTKRIECELFD